MTKIIFKKAYFEVSLVWSILDDRHYQLVIISMIFSCNYVKSKGQLFKINDVVS